MYEGLTAHVLRMSAEATETMTLDEYAGSSLRGALFQALLRRFCMNPTAISCMECPLNPTCPVAGLVAPLRDEHPRGKDVPRPFVISAARSSGDDDEGRTSGARRLEAGERFSFTLSMFGSAMAYFPYIAMILPTIEMIGVGRKDTETRRRGRPQILRVDAIDPFGTTSEAVYARGERNAHAPALAVSHEMVTARAAQLPTDRLTLRFLTPTRLVEQGQLMRTPHLRTLALRLVERLDALESAYGETTGKPTSIEVDRHARHLRIGDLASRVRLVANETQWVDLTSYSARQRRLTPIGGFIGQATYEGDVSELRELLVWGEVVHVGKNAVKGEGLYRIGSVPD